jgi:hypothetical protein
MQGIKENKTETTNVIARYDVFTVFMFKIHVLLDMTTG